MSEDDFTPDAADAGEAAGEAAAAGALPPFARWVGAAFLTVAVLDIAAWAISLVQFAWPRQAALVGLARSGPALTGIPVEVFALLALSLVIWPRRGAGVLLAAGLCFAVSQSMVFVPIPLLFGRALDRSPDAFRLVSTGATWVQAALLAAFVLLLGIGLLRSRIAAPWTGWLAVALGGLRAVQYAASRVGHPLPFAVRSAASLAEIVVELALGLALWRAVRTAEGRRGRVWPIALAAAVVFALTVALSAASVVQFGGDESRAQSARAADAAFTTAIERLVPGFGREGDMPSREADEPNTVDTLTIKRSGLAVMHVWITNGKSLGGSDGPIHGTPLAIADTTPRWYVADSYFLDHPGSRYQSIPRAEKLALWDAFSASLTRRSRVLGVFPASELRDRTLLTPWGYPASSLSSATVIVSTPEFGSGVEEEVPWSNADELVTNAADYETGNLHDDGDALARLDVTLFVRDGSNWRPVVRMASARGK